MGDISITRMEECHLLEASELEKQSFSHPWSYKAFEDALKSENYRYFVAVYEGHVVGMAGIIITCDYAELTNVAVSLEYRKMGIAYRLLEYIFEDAYKDDIQSFTLEVRCSNEPAIRLYEKAGFVNAGVRPGFYEDPKEDAYILWKNGN